MSLYLNFSEPRGIQLKVQCRDPTYVPISKTTRVNNNLGQSHQNSHARTLQSLRAAMKYAGKGKGRRVARAQRYKGLMLQ